jgi:hypothetical protein
MRQGAKVSAVACERQLLLYCAAQDDLVPVRHVEHMVKHETTARVMLNRKFHHADFLFSPSTQDRILAEFAEVRHLIPLCWLQDEVHWHCAQFGCRHVFSAGCWLHRVR